MPELPEVETTKRGISPHSENQLISRVQVRKRDLRWPIDDQLESIIEGQRVRQVGRRGKYLLLELDSGTLLIHLGMSGSLRVIDPEVVPEKHDHVDIVFNSGQCLRFNDPRRFGAILWTEEAVDRHSLISHLGPEPLTGEFDSEYLFKQSRKRKQAIKPFIMDSRVVVGVGNIYASEALYKSGIRPTRPAGKVTKQQFCSLVDEIKLVLSNAINQGGTTLRDFVGGDGKPGYFKQQLYVYGRGGEPCKQCRKPLKEIRLGQRSSVYCTQCQK